MSVNKYRKKPVVIDAVKLMPDTFDEACQFLHDASFTRHSDCIVISTLEGDHRADIGDMIIKGVAGEFYSCKPGIFAAAYEAAE